jgi:hypothetical protein
VSGGAAGAVAVDAPPASGGEHRPGDRRSGRLGRVVVGAAVAVAVVVAAVVVIAGRPEHPDALDARILGEVDGFLAWLEQHDAEGMIGEVSWPAEDPDGRWADLARRWLDRVEATGTPVAYRAAGEVWNQEEIPYLAHTASGGAGTPVDTVAGPGRLLAERGTVGLNSAGGSYNACSRQPECDFFHNAKRGRLGREWMLDSAATLRHYAANGITWLRLPIRWERLQPTLGGILDEEVASAYGATLDAARSAGLDVVIDLHNYGAYYEERDGTGVRLALGGELGEGDLADVWRRIVERWGTHPAVAGWGIMNEPVDLGDDGLAVWESASHAAVDAIRATGDRTEVLVGGYELSNVHSWPHERPWIDDPAGRVRYEAHHHWDQHHGASYEASYGEEVRLADLAGDG